MRKYFVPLVFVWGCSNKANDGGSPEPTGGTPSTSANTNSLNVESNNISDPSKASLFTKLAVEFEAKLLASDKHKICNFGWILMKSASFVTVKIEAPRLGSGGTAGVYSGQLDGREVAVKILGQGFTDDQARMFARELAFAKTSSEIEGIPKFFEVDPSMEERCRLRVLVMEKAGDAPIFGVPRPVDPVKLLEIGIRGLEILKSIHATGLVHGDVHSNNVMFWKGQNVAKTLSFIDFGRAESFVDARGRHVLQVKREPSSVLKKDFLSRYELEGSRKSRRDDIYRFAELLLNIGQYDMWFFRAPYPLEERKNNRQFQNNVPQIFIDFYKYSASMVFEQKPEYDVWIAMFKNIINLGHINMSQGHRPKESFFPDEDCIVPRLELDNGSVIDLSVKPFKDFENEVLGTFEVSFKSSNWIPFGSDVFQALEDLGGPMLVPRFQVKNVDDRCMNHLLVTEAGGEFLEMSTLGKREVHKVGARIFRTLKAVHERGVVLKSNMLGHWDGKNIDSFRLVWPTTAEKTSVGRNVDFTSTCRELQILSRESKDTLVEQFCQAANDGTVSDYEYWINKFDSI
jgi:serine/threonine protein kinase